ncbi:MAG: hypothetical protein K8S56_05505, partial [Candidatus Cloacimonetes bacterium]|nr:hypothetical protein [Candidatus Cloacimonadota bacterium]
LRYNPYTKVSNISIDGTAVPKSLLSGLSGRRFQSFVNDLIPLMERVVESTQFEISFNGRRIDYEDLAEVVKKCNLHPEYHIRLEFIPCKDNNHKNGNYVLCSTICNKDLSMSLRLTKCKTRLKKL